MEKREYTVDELKNIILTVLHRFPHKLSLKKIVLDSLKIDADPEILFPVIKQLVKEDMIIEYPSVSISDLQIEITAKGYEIIEMYDSYINYKKENRKMWKTKGEVERLKAENIKLSNLKLRFFILTSVVSFILGILLSNPIKNIYMILLSILK
jgi:hypothetical protein|nr:MAG TPA: hypothetical protein [Bacteriophage sp.]